MPKEELPRADITRYAAQPRVLKIVFLILSIGPIGLVVYYLFGFSIAGYVFFEVGYYYLLMACYLSAAFLIMPARKKDQKVPWYDLVFAALAFGIPLHFYLNSWAIVNVGWLPASTFNVVLGGILILLTVEGARRMSGPVYPALCLLVGFYPLFAEHMPGILFGLSYPSDVTISLLVFGSEGLVGLPMKVTGDILVGFLIFAGILIATGAGDFFLNLALALLGRFRGGPAKVAVVASGFFGSLSGSAISNVVATGSVTIPTMKRMGYPAHYAGAIEAVASLGGFIMPPVMGAIAFIMAVFLSVEYVVIMVAAFLPALLYYFGLLMQVDAYAARIGLKGLPREELPSLKKTLIDGWPFVFVLLFLVWGLLYMRWGAMTPFYAAGLMLLLSFYRRETWITPRRLLEAGVAVGKLISQTVAVLLPIGLIVAGFVISGTGVALTSAVVNMGGESTFLVLLLGGLACYLMGMAGVVGAAYIFLAVTLAPAVIQGGGLNELAVHLFIAYYALLAGITPPVAATAFVAAAMAGATPMKTAVTSMRLGVVVYFVPFFFVFNPALILQASILEALYLFALCLVGITLIAAGLQGYLLRIGILGWWSRPPLIIAGFLIAFPEWLTSIIGVALAVAVIAIILIRRKTMGKIKPTAEVTQ